MQVHYLLLHHHHAMRQPPTTIDLNVECHIKIRILYENIHIINTSSDILCAHCLITSDMPMKCVFDELWNNFTGFKSNLEGVNQTLTESKTKRFRMMMMM